MRGQERAPGGRPAPPYTHRLVTAQGQAPQVRTECQHPGNQLQAQGSSQLGMGVLPPETPRLHPAALTAPGTQGAHRGTLSSVGFPEERWVGSPIGRWEGAERTGQRRGHGEDFYLREGSKCDTPVSLAWNKGAASFPPFPVRFKFSVALEQ